MTPIIDRQFREVIANALPTQVNQLRNIMMSSEERRERKELVANVQMLKTAATIACFLSVGLLVMFPNFFVGCLSALVLYLAYEVRTVATNVQKIFEDFTVEARVSENKQALLEHMSKGSCLARHVIPLIW
ncbi:MAG TPA: hypothetical protein VGO47_09025 [Chlamydiales bacterium]|jgi:hypothetical protein|nr:hypothetical protein [Chlamydiales bacterium]